MKPSPAMKRVMDLDLRISMWSNIVDQRLVSLEKATTALEEKTAAISAVPPEPSRQVSLKALTFWDIHMEDIIRVSIAFAFAVVGFVMGRSV